MKRVLVALAVSAIASVCASAGTVTLGNFLVNPQSTFLYEDANDLTANALVINLNCNTAGCINAGAGTTITITGVGGLCFMVSPCSTTDESVPQLGGIFSSTNVLATSASLNPPSSVNRVTGSINAGVPNVNESFFNTVDGVNTTIANDFFIACTAGACTQAGIPDATNTANSITLVIPNNAHFLFVGVLDSGYNDNSDPNGLLGVQITEQTPEPATLSLLGAGLVGLAMLRRRLAR
jgi:hypothetical protein